MIHDFSYPKECSVNDLIPRELPVVVSEDFDCVIIGACSREGLFNS